MRESKPLPEVSEEEAFDEVVNGYLKRGGSVLVTALMDNRRFRKGGKDTSPDPFNKVIWSLATSGILYPTKATVRTMGNFLKGDGYKLTDYGKRWLDSYQNEAQFFLTNTKQFAKLLSQYNDQYGSGFRVRSQEALCCYEAHLYLSCCVMCGAATESIVLRAAIEKSKDEEGTVETYRRASGFKKILDGLSNQQNSEVKERMKEIQEVILYWRNESAHGEDSVIAEPEAHRALHLLHRFCQFIEDHWDELTAN